MGNTIAKASKDVIIVIVDICFLFVIIVHGKKAVLIRQEESHVISLTIWEPYTIFLFIEFICKPFTATFGIVESQPEYNTNQNHGDHVND